MADRCLQGHGRAISHLAGHRRTKARAAEAAAQEEAPAGEARHSGDPAVGAGADPVAESGVQGAAAGQARQAVDGAHCQTGQARGAHGGAGHIGDGLVVGQGVAAGAGQGEGAVKRGVAQADGEDVAERERVVPRGGQGGDAARQGLVRHRRTERRAREVAAGHDAGAVEGQSAHGGVGAGAHIEAGVQGAIGVEAGQPVGTGAVDARKVAADHQLPIGLHQQRLHGGVGADQAEEEGRVQGAVGVQAHDVLPRRHREAAGQEHLAVGLHGHGQDRAAHRRGREGEVQRAVGVQPRHPAAGRAVDGGEAAADDHLAHVGGEERVGVGVQGHRVDGGVSAGADVQERGVERAIDVEAQHPAPGRAVVAGEGPHHHDLGVRLDRAGVDGVVGAGAQGEAALQGAAGPVVVQDGDHGCGSGDGHQAGVPQVVGRPAGARRQGHREALRVLRCEVLGDEHAEGLVRHVARSPHQGGLDGQVQGDVRRHVQHRAVREDPEGVGRRVVVGDHVGHVGQHVAGGQRATSEHHGVAIGERHRCAGDRECVGNQQHARVLLARDARVVARLDGRAIGGGVEGADQAVGAPGAAGGDGDAAIGLAHKVGGLGEGHRAVVIHDGDGGSRQADGRTTGWATELKHHRLVTLYQRVTGHLQGDGLLKLTVGESQGAGTEQGVVSAGRRAARDSVVHGHHARATAAALNFEVLVDCPRIAFKHVVCGKFKPKGSRVAFIVQNSQRRGAENGLAQNHLASGMCRSKCRGGPALARGRT